MKLLIAVFIATIIFLNMPDRNESGYLNSNNQSQKPLFSFGIITDVHYSDYEAAGTRFYRSSPDKLREAVKVFKADSVNFIINLGDIIDKDFGSYKPVLDILDSTGLKTYHVTGNHDYSVDPRQKKRLPVLLPSREGYFSFVNENFRFIFLNGNEISTYNSNNKSAIEKAAEYIDTMKNKGEINAVEWNGGISIKQLDWLKSQLYEASGKNEKVLILCHSPVVPDNVHNLLNYKDILALLEKNQNIIAWFNGHNHAGNYGNFNMIHFVTFKGMVETELVNSYSIVEVYRNKLWIRGYGREKSQILAY
jgi:manganese-dependent ADP-ribose/CDP-alcohol diphosphatase